MSTAIPAIITKTEQASQLRAESVALGKEVSELRKKLEIAQRALGVLQDKRQKFTEESAAGRQPKPGAIETLTAEITEAQIPVDGLTRAVNEKQARLDTVRANLESLEHELHLEAQHAARLARFDALATRLRGITGEVSEMLRILIELKLPELDSAVQDLTREFINVGGVLNMGITPESAAARTVIHEAEMELWDGPYLRAERARLRQGWQPRGVGRLTEFTVRTLFLPR